MNVETSDNWITLLRRRAATQPDSLAYRFLRDGERDEVTLTYGMLDGRARAIGASLAKRFAPGSRLLLLYPPGLEFIAALMGTWSAAMVAVPCPLPKLVKPGRPRAAEESLPLIAADAKAEAALTTVRFAPVVQGALGSSARTTVVVTTDDIPHDGAAATDAHGAPPVKPGDVAVLQYTSGSTRAPRGVMLTHANLLHNSGVIRACFGHTEQSRGVIWLPHYHDMGLIGGILQPLFVGFACTLMAPAAFVQRPRRWLEAITRYGGTTSGGPNSAYELCLRAIPPAERAGLDLRTWDLAFNGAEPVRATTLQEFSEAFGPCGFRGESLYPCYGMAEASLLIAGGEKGWPVRIRSALALNDDRSASGPLVSCGRPRACDALLVVDPVLRRPCAAGVTGEIWVRGRSIGLGYFGDEAATNATFGAMLSDDQSGQTFLRTGDLGMLDDLGELFVTGRLKDLIVVGGANHYPQDIEWTAQHAHEALQIEGGCAFAADTLGAAERLFVLAELRRTSAPEPSRYAAIFAAIRRAIADAHGLQPAGIALVAAGALPRTSSGKIRRQACRVAYLAGTLAPLVTWNESDEPAPGARGDAHAASFTASGAAEVDRLFAWMAHKLSEVTGTNLQDIHPDQPLVRYGLDSPDAIALALTLGQDLGVELPATLFWDYPTLGALAEHVWGEYHVPAPSGSALSPVPASGR